MIHTINLGRCEVLSGEWDAADKMAVYKVKTQQRFVSHDVAAEIERRLNNPHPGPLASVVTMAETQALKRIDDLEHFVKKARTFARTNGDDEMYAEANALLKP